MTDTLDSSDDAAVCGVSDELAIIQTVDFFTPIVDDPYTFGAIAASNSISDVYAMGGADKAAEAGISIVGGHTVDDPEPKYGLSVMGFVHPDRLWRNVGALPGDRLVLTKPLGMGVISTGIRSGKADARVAAAATAAMATLNRLPAELAAGLEVHACTDITGFGLLGHLREMLSAGGIGASVRRSSIPILDGARALGLEGAFPGGARRNAGALAQVVRWDREADEIDRLMLCDPQTSGGLLFAVPPRDAARLVERLREAGITEAAEVGEIVADDAGHIEVSAR